MPEEREILKHDDVYQATVYTWGVKPNKHKLTHQAKVKLFGGNVGHAALELTIPKNQETETLVDKFCNHDDFELRIPYHTINKKDTEGKNQEYYQIYFSVWPSPDPEESPIYLCKTLLEDKTAARAGINYDFNHLAPGYQEGIEYRNTKGLLNIFKKNRISLPPMLVIKTPLPHDPFAKIITKSIEDFKKLYNIIRTNRDESYRLKILKRNNTAKKSIINFKQIDEQIEKIEAIIANAEYDFERLYEKTKENPKININSYIKIGKSPDSIINLPITKQKSMPNAAVGLSLVSMLQAMRKIIDNKKNFDFHKKNCSSTVLTILNSGIDPEDKKTIGKRVPGVKDYQDTSATFFKMLTPQSVYNAASSMDEAFMRQKGISNKKQNIKTVIKKLQNSRKPIPVKTFTNLLNKVKKYFAEKNQLLKSQKNNASLLFSLPKSKTTFYKKDAKTEETTLLLPKRSSRN